jgi:uncharacterized protein YyaL (SSP411 family)
MTEFRFSPRPNRAHEISWLPWGTPAFERAASEDKPILLAISAVWCHWCHVMDETTYSDGGVIEKINERFVPVRVDSDRRPDINARYNMGGWPTTAFLAPDGTALTGATYLPPHQMLSALDQIAAFYRDHKGEIEAREMHLRARGVPLGESESPLGEAPIVALIDELRRSYDREYGGFGDEPKFPQPEVHDLLLTEWRLRGDSMLYEIVARTMLGMSRGGMYDHVEGGFFRYSTTRDWSVPHFEKMAEDHAGLLRVLAALVLFAPTDEFRATLVSCLDYVRRVLRDPATGFFAGSQDADESYYALPLEERQKIIAPYVDRTSYTNWTCALAGAQCLAARALDDDAALTEALQTLDNVHDRLLAEDGLLYHVLVPDRAPEVRGLFSDQAAYIRALLDAHEISGEDRFVQRAAALADNVIERFAAEGGGFYDRLPEREALGRLALQDRPIVDNGLMAETLLRLAALKNLSAYRERAESILRLYHRTSEGAGPFAATYARTLRRYLEQEVIVRIVGDPAQTDGFREAARRLPTAFVTIHTISPQAAARFDLPAQPQPAAYVCAGKACGAPVTDPADVRAAYDALRGTPA